MKKPFEFFDHQIKAVEELRTGSILFGGLGSGKSITALLYFYTKECKGKFNNSSITMMKEPKDLFVITSARKRDTLDWEREAAMFAISPSRSSSMNNIKLTVDSWNNIKKYTEIENSFFIFDEQRVIGSGAWVKAFLKITTKNNWILLSATPGDTWMDYIPVFVANGFYKNRTQFIRRHVIYNSFTKFPKVDRFVETAHLERLKKYVTVTMDYQRIADVNRDYIFANFDKDKFDMVLKKRWNVYKNKPIKNSSEMVHLMRRVVNSDPSRSSIIEELLQKHSRLIVFYNFDYELDILRKFGKKEKIAEYNGHKHEEIPYDKGKWLYLVQYMSGGEAWNCIDTNVVVFYSQNYSYRMTKQAGGRIDRLNTPFAKLYYYHIVSSSIIDTAILKALKNKKNFNEKKFSQKLQRL